MGFHVDSSGNIWSGTNVGDTFSSANPSFYVTDAGFLYSATGSIGGVSIDSTGIEAGYTQGSAGFRIDSSGGAEFNGPILSFGKATGTPSGAGTTSIKLGDAILFSRDEGSAGNHLFSTKPFVVMADGDEDNPSLTIQGDYQKMGFFLESSTDLGGFDSFKASNGNDDIFSFNSNSTNFAVLGTLVLSSAIQVGGSTGTSGQVLSSTGNGLSWANTSGHSHSGYSFPNSGTLLSSDNHAHGTPLTSNHENASNPHDNYLQEADHNANNTAHSNFLTSSDLSSHITNNNNIYNSVVDHTDITANQGGGSAHGLSLSGVNAAVLHVNDNSQHTNHNHNFTLAEDPHGNGEHNEAYITNNNANAHHGNAYAAPHNGHSHSHNEYAGNHNHPYLNENHNNQVGHHTHNSGVATDPHGNGDHNASFITNSNANAHHGNTYANFTHAHLNPLTHDDRLLSVNANSVPGLNVVQRMNPVTANFSEQYKNRLLEEPSSLTELNQKTYRLTYQDVKQALEDDGVDTTDVAMIIENVEYANELAPELDDDMKGLMEGEIDAILVQAIKDLSAKIDLLEDRIATLEG